MGRRPFIFRCDVLDWHKPDSCLGFDGASFTARCKRCKRRILQDSQSNWFAAFLQYDDGGDTP